MSEFTPEKLTELKRVVEKHKSDYTRAQGQEEEVRKSIESYRKQLSDLGVDPDDAQGYLEREKEKLNKKFEEISEEVRSIEEALKE